MNEALFPATLILTNVLQKRKNKKRGKNSSFRVQDETLINNIIPRSEKRAIYRSRFLSISREPRTSRSHVTSALAGGLQFEVHVCT